MNASSAALTPFIADWIVEADAVEFLTRRGFDVLGVRLERLGVDALRKLAVNLELDADQRWLSATAAVVRRAFASRFDIAWPTESINTLEKAFRARKRYACYGAWNDVGVSACDDVNWI